jgi:hypothetical protein
MPRLSTVLKLSGLLALTMGQTAQAAQTPTCLSQAEMEGMFSYAGKSANWSVAKSALFKIAAQDKGKGADGIGLLRLLPDSALQPLADTLVTQELAKAIKPDDCAPIERIVGLLAPLPPENTSALVTTIIALTDKPKPDGKGSDSGLHLCPVAKG